LIHRQTGEGRPLVYCDRLSRRARAGIAGSVLFSVGIAGREAEARYGELPNHVPEPAPYDITEAKAHPPPYDAYFAQSGNPRVCAQCHQRIFAEWNGSMMSNSWRDPAWRAAFFLLSRLTATDGTCGTPAPPDGTTKARLNPFSNGNCTSTFDLGASKFTTHGSGSLLDSFCSRCHMPANYIDAFRPQNVRTDGATGIEHALADPDFDPTASRGTPYAFATGDHSRNSLAGKLGITCTFCHVIGDSRETPFHNYARSGVPYAPDVGTKERAVALPPALAEVFAPPDASSRTLGYSVGAGAYRVSPEALVKPERFGPLSFTAPPAAMDPYTSATFASPVPYQQSDFAGSIHKGNYSALFERAEMCGQCHDVTNPMTIKNALGRWVGGFPIERTYSEWASSRYAERPGNANFDPAWKRDCQTCHMQQDFGRPGTAQTLFDGKGAVSPLTGKPAVTGRERPVYYSHHFVGGNTYVTHLLGGSTTLTGDSETYPELSKYSFSSADPKSPYHAAVWENGGSRAPATQHARMAWDRLRNAVTVDLRAPEHITPGALAELSLTVTNTGAGHDFPTGFPEGRNAWVAVRAYDLATGDELVIADSYWKRRSLGVGYLTDRDGVDPNFPGCNWQVPAGAPDPFAYQFRAVASRGDACPTLDLPYATPLNLVVGKNGVPRDAAGLRIGRQNPPALPRFEDVDGDGDLYDDSFLVDTRLRPLPHAEARVRLDRYSVVVPEDAKGPIAVTAAVYYQSMEAVVAKKLLGNLADTDGDDVLEPCVLRGRCDGRVPEVEPAVVEGAPPVPIRVESRVIRLEDEVDTTPPTLSTYPADHAGSAHVDTVPKVTASEPIRGIDTASFRLFDEAGAQLPGSVAQIADFTWAFFPDQIFLSMGHAYRVRLAGVFCDYADNCVNQDRSFGFTVASSAVAGTGDTRPPPPRPATPAPTSELRASVLETSRPGPWLVGFGAALLFWLAARSRWAWAAALVPVRRRYRG
jgi:hypothetical protein